MPAANSDKNKSKQVTAGKRVAFGGIVLAINILTLVLMNYIPINTIFFMVLASLFPSIIIMEHGIKAGVSYSFALVFLSFILITSRLHMFEFVLIFSMYGLVKSLIESRIISHTVQYILKILYACISLGICYFLLVNLKIIPYFGLDKILIGLIAFVILFIIYDIFYTYAVGFYLDNIDKIKNKSLPS